MKKALWLGGVVSAIMALLIVATARSAIHEIEAGIAALISAVAWSGYGIIGAIEKQTQMPGVKQ